MDSKGSHQYGDEHCQTFVSNNRALLTECEADISFDERNVSML